MSTQSDIKEALTAAAGGAAALAPVLPGPAGIVAGIVAAALGSAASLLDQGQTPEQIVAAMHRARRIDTSVEDAAVDALVAAKPPAQHVVIQPVDPAHAALLAHFVLGGPAALPDEVRKAATAIVVAHDGAAP